jgi:MFS family permease
MTRLRLAAGDTFRSLHVRNFRLFFVGQIISQVGNWLTLVAQTLLVYKLTNSGVAVGLLAAFQFGPVLLLGAWAGLIADRSDKRRLLLTVQALAMVQSFVLAALAFTGNPPVWAIYAVATFGGITVAFDNPTRRAFVVEMVPDRDMNNAVSLNSALMTSSRVIGPALAGLLAATVGFGWCFTVDGLSYIAVLIALVMMRTAELRPAKVTPKAKGQIREGLRYVRSVPELWVPLMMMAVIGTLAYNFQVVLPLFATRDLGGQDALFTVMLSAISLGSLCAALYNARRTTITVRIVGLAAMAFGAAMLLLSVAPGAPAALVIAFFVGLGSMSFMTASTAIVQIRSNPSMRGRVLALQSIVFLGSTPIGGPIVGWLSQQFGARWGLAVGAVATLAAGLWGLTSVRRGAVTREALSREQATDAVNDAVADVDREAPPTGEVPAVA